MKHDTLVVLGEGSWVKAEDGSPKISPFAYERGVTAALLSNHFDLIIFTGGHTAGREHPSEAISIYNVYNHYTQCFFSDEAKPHPTIVIEETSLDTFDNFRNLLKLDFVKDIGKVSILSSLYINPSTIRAGAIAERILGCSVERIPTEMVLDSTLKVNRSIQAPRDLKLMLKSFVKEVALLGLIYTIDPNGKIPRLLTRSRNKGSSD